MFRNFPRLRGLRPWVPRIFDKTRRLSGANQVTSGTQAGRSHVNNHERTTDAGSTSLEARNVKRLNNTTV